MTFQWLKLGLVHRLGNLEVYCLRVRDISPGGSLLWAVRTTVICPTPAFWKLTGKSFFGGIDL